MVTGHDAAGRARVVDDRRVEAITSDLMPGRAAYRLRGRDERPTFPDDGDQTVLRAGDVVVQNGTRHAWRNHSPGPCTIVAVGADRAA